MKIYLKNFIAVLFVFAMVVFASCEPRVTPDGPNKPNDSTQVDTTGNDTTIIPVVIDTTTQFAMQYCDDSVRTALGQDYTSTMYVQSAAIKLTKSQLQAFLSNYVIKMSVGLHGQDQNAVSTEYKDLKFWIRKSLGGEDLWSQEYTGEIKLKDWNTMVMDPFFELKEPVSDLYFGYTINANGLIIGCDGSQDPDKNGCWIYDCATKKWMSYTEMGNMSIRCIISGNNMPQNDAALVAIETAEYAKPNVGYTFVATVENKALTPLNSFDIVVKASGVEYLRETVVLSTPLARNQVCTFFVNDVKLTNAATMDVEYIVDNVNGAKQDDNESDNSIVVKTVVANNLVDRVVLLENTTGDMCSNCPAGHKYIEEAMHAIGEDKFIWMAHHAGYNAGKYTSNQSDTIARIFYNTQMTYAPGLMIDRTNLLAVGVTTSGTPGGPIFSVNEVASRGMLDEYFRLMQSDMSPIALNVEHSFDASTRNLSVTVKGDILAEISNRNNLAIGIALLEDNLEGTQAGIAGKYMHNHVCRDGLVSILGEKVGGSGNTFEFTSSKKLKDAFKPENMTIVVWVANKPASMSDCDNYKVYQSQKIKLVK